MLQSVSCCQPNIWNMIPKNTGTIPTSFGIASMFLIGLQSWVFFCYFNRIGYSISNNDVVFAVYFFATIAWYASVKDWFTGPKVDVSLQIEKREEGEESEHEEALESDALLGTSASQPTLNYRSTV